MIERNSKIVLKQLPVCAPELLTAPSQNYRSPQSPRKIYCYAQYKNKYEIQKWCGWSLFSFCSFYKGRSIFVILMCHWTPVRSTEQCSKYRHRQDRKKVRRQTTAQNQAVLCFLYCTFFPPSPFRKFVLSCFCFDVGIFAVWTVKPWSDEWVDLACQL